MEERLNNLFLIEIRYNNDESVNIIHEVKRSKILYFHGKSGGEDIHNMQNVCLRRDELYLNIKKTLI